MNCIWPDLSTGTVSSPERSWFWVWIRFRKWIWKCTFNKSLTYYFSKGISCFGDIFWDKLNCWSNGKRKGWSLFWSIYGNNKFTLNIMENLAKNNGFYDYVYKVILYLASSGDIERNKTAIDLNMSLWNSPWRNSSLRARPKKPGKRIWMYLWFSKSTIKFCWKSFLIIS